MARDIIVYEQHFEVRCGRGVCGSSEDEKVAVPGEGAFYRRVRG